jgi:C-terminal processing protease CtpA/Prc
LNSICKGPPERPGIFIQSTKEGGLAKELGLKPGDQILECNGMPLDDLDFSEVSDATWKQRSNFTLN